VWASSKLGAGVQGLGASWAYAWSRTPEKSFNWLGRVPSGIELVPLIQRGQDPAQDIVRIKSKGYKTILGYNEPAGSSLNPAEAANF